MTIPEPIPFGKVAVGDIADIAGVSASAVSNWRVRHTDFPIPVERSAGGDLFDLQAVYDWLRDHGKTVEERFGSDRFHQEVGAILRQFPLRLEHSVLLVLQLLYVRFSDCLHATVGTVGTSAWERLRLSTALQTWNEVVMELSEDKDVLRVMSLPSGTTELELQTTVKFIDQISFLRTEPGEIATSILRHYEFSRGAGASSTLTTSDLSELLVRLLQPITGSVYDPAVGFGMVLAEAWRSRGTRDVQIFGQEVSEFAWKLAYLHLALNAAPFEVATGDTLREDRFRSLKADRAVVDPPYGFGRDELVDAADERWVFGSSTSPQWLWAQHLLFHLSSTGVGILVVPPAVLYGKGRDASIRKKIVESGHLDAVIELPQGLIYGNSAGVALLIFAKSRVNRAHSVLFLNARQLGKPRRGKAHALAAEDIASIDQTVTEWRNGAFREMPLFAASATVANIVENDGDLSPQRYIRFGAPATAQARKQLEERSQKLKKGLDQKIQGTEAFARAIDEGAGKLTSISANASRHVKLGQVLLDTPQPGTRQNTEIRGAAVPYILTRNVSDGSSKLAEPPDEISYGTAVKKLAQRGDLLLVARGLDQSTGGCAIVDFEGGTAYAQSLLRLRPDSSVLLAEFLQLFLTSSGGRAALAAGTTGSVIGNLRPQALCEIELPLPPLEAQWKIVDSMRQFEEGVAGVTEILNASMAFRDVERDRIVTSVAVSPDNS